VTTSRSLFLALCGSAVLAACGDSSGPDNQAVDCASVAPTSLGVGQHVVLDGVLTPCVQLPAAGAEGAEHLLVTLSGQGQETDDGVTASFALTAANAGTAAVAARRPTLSQTRVRTGVAASFHAKLRAREAALVRRNAGARVAASRRPAVAVPPSVGEERTFSVCQTTGCDDFVQVTATAQLVGQRVAIFLDNAAPAEGYTGADIQHVGDVFDNYLHPIDTTAFGSESDLDGNEVVIVLLSARVNQLVPNCNDVGSIVAGYFFGLDLLPSLPNSNAGEIFYGLVPDPDNNSCTISRDFAVETLPAVFVHEFAHMIGFNQRVLVRGATDVEQTWLDEGLAHMAEELAGRLVPDAECQPLFDNCASQFASSDLANAYLYLEDPEASFLIQPDTTGGDLPDLGANWLFVRWLADHYAATQPTGVEVTRGLVQTTLRGSANVEHVAGEPFDDLVSRWQLANYLDDLPGLTPDDPTLQYTSWAFRDVYRAGFEDGVFLKPYPLTPDSTLTGTYSHAGVLRGGSGKHFRVIQPGSAGPVLLRLTRSDGSSRLADDAEPRIALIRIR
jgi:hypothetical protein